MFVLVQLKPFCEALENYTFSTFCVFSLSSSSKSWKICEKESFLQQSGKPNVFWLQRFRWHSHSFKEHLSAGATFRWIPDVFLPNLLLQAEWHKTFDCIESSCTTYMFSVASVSSHSCNVLSPMCILRAAVACSHHQPSSDSRGRNKWWAQLCRDPSVHWLIYWVKYVRMYIWCLTLCPMSLYLCHCKVYIPSVGALSFFHGFGPVCRNTPAHCARRVGQINSNGLPHFLEVGRYT